MTAIRIILIIAAVFLVFFIVRSVRKSKMRIEDSLFWVILSVVILILSIFPQIASWCSVALGFQSPINFIYVFFIAVLLVKCFTMSIHASQLETKITELTQKVAIEQLEHHERQQASGQEPADKLDEDGHSQED